MLIRSSVLSTIKLCPQRAHFSYDLGLVSKNAKPSIDLVFGTIVHKSIELFHKQSKEAALEYLHEVEFEQTNAKSRLKAITLFNSYVETEPLDLIDYEKDFTFKIGKHVWKGRFDGVANLFDSLYIVDHKTTNPYFLSTKPDDQFIAYWMGGRIFYHEVKGVIVNSLDPASLVVKRIIVSYTKDEFEHWRDETKLLLAFYQRCFNVGIFPKTPKACIAYGRQCPFRILCTSPPEVHERIIERYYDVSVEKKEKNW